MSDLDNHPVFDLIATAAHELAKRLEQDPMYDPFLEDTPGRRRFLAELERIERERIAREARMARQLQELRDGLV